MEKITITNPNGMAAQGINVAYIPGELTDPILFAQYQKYGPLVAIVRNVYAQGTIVDLSVYTNYGAEAVVTRDGVPASGLVELQNQWKYNTWDWPNFSN